MWNSMWRPVENSVEKYMRTCEEQDVTEWGTCVEQCKAVCENLSRTVCGDLLGTVRNSI